MGPNHKRKARENHSIIYFVALDFGVKRTRMCSTDVISYVCKYAACRSDLTAQRIAQDSYSVGGTVSVIIGTQF